MERNGTNDSCLEPRSTVRVGLALSEPDHAMRELSPRTPTGTVFAIAAAWVVSLGIDLFLHGGVLATLYREPSPFLLDAEEAFRRIPLGYLAFLGLTVGLYWLVRQLEVSGALAGFRVAAATGTVVWGALLLGLYSISTASLSLLLAWWVGQTIELGAAGAVLGAFARGVPLRRIWTLVIAGVVACIAGTIALQAFGLAPAMKTVP